MMTKWPLDLARNQFSKVVEQAQTDGPQMVTRRGRPAVVIVSAKEFSRMARPEESVLAFFAPLKNSGIRIERRRD